MATTDMKHIACWFSNKKKKKISIDYLRALFKNKGANLSEIDLDADLDEQGPFDAIIHKLTDLVIEEMEGNKQAAKNLYELQSYLKRHPKTILIDPLFSVRRLLNRYETYKLIKSTKICSKDAVVHVPSFALILTKDKEVILKEMRAAGVRFPIMCKKNIAHGTASHKMSIIFDENGLSDVDPPCVAQTFIDHNALLYKIYVIADKFHMVERPSLRNFTKERSKGRTTIFFNSHDISSCDSMRSKLTTLEDDDGKPEDVDMDIVRLLTQQLHREISMTMYGIDVIVCRETRKHYVIDVNVFPGYDGVANYLEILADTVMERIKEKDISPSCNGVHPIVAPPNNGFEPDKHHIFANSVLNGISNGCSEIVDV